jgi:hypothetical protein
MNADGMRLNEKPGLSSAVGGLRFCRLLDLSLAAACHEPGRLSVMQCNRRASLGILLPLGKTLLAEIGIGWRAQPTALLLPIVLRVVRAAFTTTVSLKTTQFGHIADKHSPQRPPILLAGGKGNAKFLSWPCGYWFAGNRNCGSSHGSSPVSPACRAIARRSASRLGSRWVRSALLGTSSGGA